MPAQAKHVLILLLIFLTTSACANTTGTIRIKDFGSQFHGDGLEMEVPKLGKGDFLFPSKVFQNYLCLNRFPKHISDATISPFQGFI
jgi:hypothetical protein